MLRQSISQKPWFCATVLLAITNVIHAMFFDWSDLRIHGALGGLCVLAALRWQRGAAAIAALVLLFVICGTWLWSPPDWTLVRTGDDWNRTQQRLGAPIYEASNLAQARLAISGYAIPSPLRFRHSGPVAIFVRGEYALWVMHDGRVVKGTFVGGS
jgi:hypothetical protein